MHRQTEAALIRAKELISKRFGKLTVDSVQPNQQSLEWYGAYLLCRCDCGNMREVPRRYLIRGQVKSCGKCINKKRSIYEH